MCAHACTYACYVCVCVCVITRVVSVCLSRVLCAGARDRARSRFGFLRSRYRPAILFLSVSFFFYPPALLVLICRFRFPSPTLARRKRHSAAAGIHPSPGGTGNGGKENEAATIVVAGSRDDHGRRVARQVVWTHTPPIRIVSWILHAFFFLSNRVESEKRERRLKLSSCRNRSRWPGLGFYCCSAVCRGWLLLLLLLLLLTECCAASLRQFRRDSCGMTHSIRCSVK